MKRKTKLSLYCLVSIASLAVFILPTLAMSPGDTVNFHVSADPDLYDHANADATLSYYTSGADEYVRVDFYWGKASIGGAIMYFEIGKEFTIIETNFPSPEHHITVAWHPWWAFGFPVYGEGSRELDSSLSPVYFAQYYFIAKRVDYLSGEVWAELMVSVIGSDGMWDVDTDWQSLSLPVPPKVTLTIRVPQAPPEGVYVFADNQVGLAYASTPASFTVSTHGQHVIEVEMCFDKEQWTPGTYFTYTFYQWSDGSKDNPRTMYITSPTTLTANYMRSKYGMR